MKKQFITIIALLFSIGLFAQGVFNNGANIAIGSGTYLNISGTAGNLTNATNGSDGAIALSGTLKLEGNFINNVAGADILSPAAPGSEVIFAGTTAQIIGGTTSATFNFDKLTINNPAGIALSKDALVNNTLTLTNGLFTLGTSNLSLAPAAVVGGTPSASAMVVATGTGELRKQFSTIGSFIFPVGDNNLTAKFSPVTLNFTAGTFASGAYAGVNLVNAAHPDPYITGSYLNRYWNVSQTGISALTANAVFAYNPVDVVGTEGNIYCVRMLPNPISLFDPANINIHQLTATGLTAFGTFTGALGIRTLNLTAFLEGLYNGAGIMRSAQGATGNQFPTPTADQITVELHSAVAGQYATINFSAPNTNLSTAGLATMSVPATFNGSYYLTVKHRNSLETVSALPVSFSGSTISYNFSTAIAQAFGSNMKNIGGVSVIYGGDVDQDGGIGNSDMGLVDNKSAVFAGGYISEDVDGDGSVGNLDMGIIDNNSSSFVSVIRP